jgi:alcohol dehydrogenase (cytochrome c)
MRRMARVFLSIAVGIMAVGWCGLIHAQTMDELINDGKDPVNVVTQSLGFDRRNYSPLTEINKSNVKRLVPVWSTSLMNDIGELGAPTVYNGVMYIVNGKWTFAIDVATGRQLWRSPITFDEGVYKVATFGAINRGAATIYNGKIYRVTIDNHLLAVDQKTGKVVSDQVFADFREGYTATGAPIVAGGVLISGMAGGEYTTRGFLDGWDPETGQKLWRRYTVPAPGEPGSETWPKKLRRMEMGRRRHMALGLVRPGAGPRVLGHRQCRAIRSATTRTLG